MENILKLLVLGPCMIMMLHPLLTAYVFYFNLYQLIRFFYKKYKK